MELRRGCYGKCPVHPRQVGTVSSRVLLMLEGRKDFILGLERGRFTVEVALSDWMYRQKPQEWHFRRPWTRSAYHGASNLCCALGGRSMLWLKIKIIVVIK